MAILEDDGVLVFLHADTTTPPEAGQALSDHFGNPAHDIALFRARFDRWSPILRVYSWFTRFESYWTGFGDQIISIRKRLHREIGGFPSRRSFEDMGLLREARRRTRIARIPVWVTTSARTFDAAGQARRQLRNAWMLLRFRFGASPGNLYESYYRPVREQREIQATGDALTHKRYEA